MQREKLEDEEHGSRTWVIKLFAQGSLLSCIPPFTGVVDGDAGLPAREGRSSHLRIERFAGSILDIVNDI